MMLKISRVAHRREPVRNRLGGAGNPCWTTSPSPSPVAPWQGTQNVSNIDGAALDRGGVRRL